MRPALGDGHSGVANDAKVSRLLALATLSALVAQRSLAQTTTRLVTVGILSGASLSTPGNVRFRDAFVEALRQRGWEEGKNLIVEARAAEGDSRRFAELAAELMALNVDVAVGSNSQAVRALKDSSSTVPIVMLDASRPVEAGFIASLAHPGGNITGVTPYPEEVALKPVELLRELMPGTNRIGVLFTPGNAGSALSLKESQQLIPMQLGISVIPVPIETAADIDLALDAINREGLRAVNIHPTPVINTNRVRIAMLLNERRVVTVSSTNTLVRDGILMSYGPDQVESWRGAATYVDRILRGAKPADLPVQQPTKFELVINLKTAKALNLTIPPTLLARADEVIE